VGKDDPVETGWGAKALYDSTMKKGPTMWGRNCKGTKQAVRQGVVRQGGGKE